MLKSFSDDVDIKKIVFIVGGILWSFVTFFLALNSYGAGNWKGVSENPFLLSGIIISFILIFIIFGIWNELAVVLRKVTVTDDGTVSIPGRGRLSQSVVDLFSKFLKSSSKNGYSYPKNNKRLDKSRPYFYFARENVLEARLASANDIMPIGSRPLNQKYVTNPENAVLIKFKNALPYMGSGSWENMPNDMKTQIPDFARQMHEKIAPENPIEEVFVSVKEPHKLIEELEK